MNKTKTAIISLGGSLIVPNKIDVVYLKRFKKFIEKNINNGWRFIIVTGGGMTSRKYQEAAGKVVKLSDDDLDWLGIHTTKLNAHLMRSIFRKDAHPVLSKNPEQLFKSKKPILIASGWKPGWSTDYVSVKMAETYGGTTVLNLSNIDYVYTSDPRKNSDAKKVTDITWSAFQKIVGTKWVPGANLPFDPIASKLAKKMSLDVFILQGKDLSNIEKVLLGKPFKGTHIHT